MDYGNFSENNMELLNTEMNGLKELLSESSNSSDEINESENSSEINLYCDEVLGKVLSAMGQMFFAQLDIFDNYISECCKK